MNNVYIFILQSHLLIARLLLDWWWSSSVVCVWELAKNKTTTKKKPHNFNFGIFLCENFWIVSSSYPYIETKNCRNSDSMFIESSRPQFQIIDSSSSFSITIIRHQCGYSFGFDVISVSLSTLTHPLMA